MYLYTHFFREEIQIKQEYENVEDFPGGPVAKALPMPRGAQVPATKTWLLLLKKMLMTVEAG